MVSGAHVRGGKVKPDACIGCPCYNMGSDFSEVELGSRYETTRMVIIGEASGEAEAREQLPFRPYAMSGSLLTDAMREMNISRSEVAITNICRCRPKSDYLSGAPYEHKAIAHCIQAYLYDTLKELKPRVILALGTIAMRSLAPTVRGRYGTMDYVANYVQRAYGPADGIPVISTWHPAYLRRGKPKLIPKLQGAIRRAFYIGMGKMIEGTHYATDLGKLNLRYQTSPTIDEAWEWARNIDPDLPLSLDLETPKSTREDEDERVSFVDRDIVLFQATQRRGEGIALPWRDEYIDVAKAILTSKTGPKLGHNWWAFDHEVLRANGVSLPHDFNDTMIMFHHYWSELPANLQAAAQMCGFQFNWKHLNEVDQAFYGCADVDAALCVHQYMKGLLEREGLWDSYYSYDFQFWPILREMSWRGIRIAEDQRLDLLKVIEVEKGRIKETIQPLVPQAILSSKQAKGGYKNPPKLKCEDCGYEGREDHVCEDGTTILYTTLAEGEGLVLREIVIKEGEKCRCKKSTRAECHVCVGTGIIPAGTVEPWWTYLKEFNPTSWKQVRRLIKGLGHPLPKHLKRTDENGEPAETTERKELDRLYTRTKHPIYPLIMEWRDLSKMKGTYVEGYQPGSDGKIHSTFGLLTATGQLTSKNPNVQNSPVRGKSEFQKGLFRTFNQDDDGLAGMYTGEL